MPKSLSSLWLKSVRRMGKAQQAQGRRLLQSLVPQRPRSAGAPCQTRQGGQGPRPATALRKSAALPARAVTGLPGSWQKCVVFGAGRRPARARRGACCTGFTCRREPARRRCRWWSCCMAASRRPPTLRMSTRMNELAARKGFAVLYPQQSAAADAHRCWHWYKRPTQEGLGDVRLIADMMAQVQARHGLDPAAPMWRACRPARAWPTSWRCVTRPWWPRWACIRRRCSAPPTRP